MASHLETCYNLRALKFRRKEKNINHLDVARRLKYLFFRLKEGLIPEDLKVQYMDEIDALLSIEDDNIDIDQSLKEYERIRQVTKRVRRRITELMVFSPCSFLTLTFTDEVLASTSEETRRTYVRKYLKSVSDNYVANIDYGKINGREHYHAVVESQDIDLSGWTYGMPFIERIRNNNILTDTAKLSKYINKLSNHATKRTTKGKKIIYSRQK